MANPITRFAMPTTRVVPAASSKMLEVYVGTNTELSCELIVAAAALTGFSIILRPNAVVVNTNTMTAYSVAGDFTSPQGLLIGCSGDLTTQAIGTGWFIMDIRGFYCMELWATSGGTATLLIEEGMS